MRAVGRVATNPAVVDRAATDIICVLRAAHGKEVLLKGKLAMPAKGGNAMLSEADIKAT